MKAVCCRFAHPFSADTGTSVGDMMGHSKRVNAVSFKQNRPFRIVTASEDQTMCFYHGPPFKLNTTMEVSYVYWFMVGSGVVSFCVNECKEL